ncbi:ABC transporter permease subunit [Cryobacterium sinapicolor]|uniref:ABC transporter permease subunit n=1 Tax=Cryobacterium sinapicolor TaxID=1259236 RepID=A0ABY2IX34_9MICO|nr:MULTISPECIES: ABC transporter permease subunit [Cryobacterium]TFC31628.1 ABC transporter permease subunit [Cryobacterium sp. TMT2-18-2]TFC33503.1 ABC transporter permease subunit [Cryobacterium sp. TMT2-42-4]TFC61804.1 ABC transporter permease subunit [Cryobacterium sp. TMT2-15-1]TFC67709.1 ABC transporter permease subunit [Cryobacterium sp. TMT2-18-3]TFC91282.1 ABC transporter permease subunit [Cryobacterium sp. TMT3-29-2]
MDSLIDLLPELWIAAGETLYIVGLTLFFGGIGGLLVGLGLYLTRAGSILENRGVFVVLNLLVNIVRPIPFIIFLAAAQPLARVVVGTGIGNAAIIFTISLAASFAMGRIVEQNLLTVTPGVIEAARSVGAGPIRIIFTVLLPEALGPLILGYTFIFVALVDMSAVAGYVGGGGLGNFALLYGYRQFNPVVTWAAVLLIIVLVQLVQFLGNWLARKAFRR